MKAGDPCQVYFDGHTGTPGRIRSISEDGALMTIWFGHGWQTVPSEIVKPALENSKERYYFNRVDLEIINSQIERTDYSNTDTLKIWCCHLVKMVDELYGKIATLEHEVRQSAWAAAVESVEATGERKVVNVQQAT